MVLKAVTFPTVSVKGRNAIIIENVHPQAALARTDCHLLNMWVRVDGPEIFAGMAVAVQPDDNDGAESDSNCYWEFVYELHEAGEYRVDAKVLVWNGLASGRGLRYQVAKCTREM
jgi:hypothetical protein